MRVIIKGQIANAKILRRVWFLYLVNYKEDEVNKGDVYQTFDRAKWVFAWRIIK